MFFAQDAGNTQENPSKPFAKLFIFKKLTHVEAILLVIRGSSCHPKPTHLEAFEDIWKHLQTFGDIRRHVRYLETFGDNWQTFGNIWRQKAWGHPLDPGLGFLENDTL